jgi:hypothetical protein
MTAFLRKALSASHKADVEAVKPIRAYPGTSNMDYSKEETIFLAKIDEYKRRTGRVFLTNTEYFALLTKELGYTRQEA